MAQIKYKRPNATINLYTKKQKALDFTKKSGAFSCFNAKMCNPGILFFSIQFLLLVCTFLLVTSYCAIL